MNPREHIAETRYEQTGPDDYKVDSNKHPTQRDVLVLVDTGCDNIRSTRRTIMQKDYGKTRSGNHTAYDERHKLLPLTENEMHLAVGTGH